MEGSRSVQINYWSGCGSRRSKTLNTGYRDRKMNDQKPDKKAKKSVILEKKVLSSWPVCRLMWLMRFLLLPKRFSHCGQGNSPSSGRLGVPLPLRGVKGDVRPLSLRMSATNRNKWKYTEKAVLRIHDILVLSGSGSGSGSCYFRHWHSRRQQKTNFLKSFSAYYFWRYINIIFKS
jgi:hypothetical protein